MTATEQRTALTGLFVMPAIHTLADDTEAPESWCVLLHQSATVAHGLVVSGFASKRDAEIGMASLNDTDIPWHGSLADIIAHVTAFGGEAALRKCAVQNLPW